MIPDFAGAIEKAISACSSVSPMIIRERFQSALIKSDFLSATSALAKQQESGALQKASVVYLDPPFLTGNEHIAPIKLRTDAEVYRLERHAFSDKYTLEEYLVMLATAIISSREMLADEGSLWIHLDSRTVHYVKIIADEIFGGKNHFINEVIWYYKSGGSGSKRFSNKHDTLLFYAKDPKKLKFKPQVEKSYNRGMRPYRFKGVREYQDSIGWYTLVNMKDVWEIPMVGRTSKERTGYATQKPVALLERIIGSCSDEGDLCIDLFGGSGTMAAAAAKKGRSWISIDSSPLAIAIAEKRLGAMSGENFSVISSNYNSAVRDTAIGAEVSISTNRRAEVETILAGPGTSLLIEKYRPGQSVLDSYTEEERAGIISAAEYDPSQFIVLADICVPPGGQGSGEPGLRLVDIFGAETYIKLN